jgi:hypothetical protein
MTSLIWEITKKIAKVLDDESPADAGLLLSAQYGRKANAETSTEAKRTAWLDKLEFAGVLGIKRSE